jgi:uncharacterized protein YjbI with pentapeptide repeats
MSDKRPQRPMAGDRGAWGTYWAAQGMPWRTEPEIDAERQRFLAGRLAVRPDVERGIYPFRDEHGAIKLTRADVEWLLATHESGGVRGPVDLNDTRQREREGLDLRGADLGGVDLGHLPLARLLGGVPRREWLLVSLAQREAAALHLEGANLRDAHLEGASLRGVYLQRAYLRGAHLEGSALVFAHVDGASFFTAHLEGLVIPARPPRPRGRRRDDGALVLPPADLHLATFDGATNLSNAVLGTRRQGGIRLADARWNDVNLARASWRAFTVLGDELVARFPYDGDGAPKGPARRSEEYETAVRAYRQLSIALRSQGVNEDADRFAYRAQVLQRLVLRRQRQFLRAFGSWLLDLVAGYGYKPLRSVLTYVAVVLAFAAAYLVLGAPGGHPLSWNEALVVSLTAFHGRGFFATAFQPGDPQAAIAAGEAVIGLLIEITFIATFTQRFFAR